MQLGFATIKWVTWFSCLLALALLAFFLVPRDEIEGAWIFNNPVSDEQNQLYFGSDDSVVYTLRGSDGAVLTQIRGSYMSVSAHRYRIFGGGFETADISIDSGGLLH